MVILCEDRQQEVLARHFLTACGISRKRIRSVIAPKGLGSGEHYVRERYPDEVQGYRQKCNHLNIALVVMIDADTHSVKARFDQLEDCLIEKRLPGRGPDERIGIFVPRRNIETWIHYLQGAEVNEVDVYPRLPKESDCKPLAHELAQRRSQPLPDNAPDSLKTACDELARIL